MLYGMPFMMRYLSLLGLISDPVFSGYKNVKALQRTFMYVELLYQSQLMYFVKTNVVITQNLYIIELILHGGLV